LLGSGSLSQVICGFMPGGPVVSGTQPARRPRPGVASRLHRRGRPQPTWTVWTGTTAPPWKRPSGRGRARTRSRRHRSFESRSPRLPRRSAEAELADYESAWARPPVHTNSLQPMAGASSGPPGIDERHRVGLDRSRRRSGAVNLGRVHKLLRGSRPSPRLPGHPCTPVGGVPLIVMM
jgi:hypothetical protein